LSYLTRIGIEIIMLYEFWEIDVWWFAFNNICPNLEVMMCFVLVLWFLYPPRRVDLLVLALGCLAYFCLLAKIWFSCWIVVSCFENVIPLEGWCNCVCWALVSWSDMLIWLMCWILNWFGVRKLDLRFLYKGWGTLKYLILFIYSLLIKKTRSTNS